MLAVLLPVCLFAGQQGVVDELLRRSDQHSSTKVFAARRSLAPYVVNALHDPAPEVRLRAVRALRTMDWIRGVDALIEAGRDADPAVALEAVLTLIDLGRPRSFMIHGETRDVRISARKIAKIGPSAVPILHEFLTKPPRTASDRTALEVLDILHDPSSADVLIKYIDGAQAWELSTAINALAQYDDPRVIRCLVRNIGKGVGDYGGTPSIWALKRLGNPGRMAIEERLRHDANRNVRFCCAQALGDIADPKSIPALTGKAADPDASVRLVVAMALREFSGPEVESVLILLIRDKIPIVAQAAMRSADKVKSRRAFEAVSSLLHSPLDFLRYEAWEIVARLDPVRARPLVLDATYTRENRLGATAALEHLPFDQARRRLVELLDSPDKNVGTVAAQSLTGNPYLAAAPALWRALDREPESKEIVAALCALGPHIVDEAMARLSQVRLRGAVISILAASKSPQAGPALIPLISNEWAPFAIEAIGKLSYWEAIPLLLPKIAKSDPLFPTIVKALTALHAKDAIAPLHAILEQDWNSELAEALIELGDPAMFEILKRRAEDKRLESNRWGALRLMGTLPRDQVFEYLVSKLQVDDLYVLNGAAAGLLLLGDIAALPALRRAYNDPDLPIGYDLVDAVRAFEAKAKRSPASPLLAVG